MRDAAITARNSQTVGHRPPLANSFSAPLRNLPFRSYLRASSTLVLAVSQRFSDAKDSKRSFHPKGDRRWTRHDYCQMFPSNGRKSHLDKIEVHSPHFCVPLTSPSGLAAHDTSVGCDSNHAVPTLRSARRMQLVGGIGPLVPIPPLIECSCWIKKELNSALP
jgi:hypothetical protein